MSSTRLISHWPLVTDARDAAGDAHGNPSDVAFGVTVGERCGTVFNGGSSVIRIPDSESVRLGNRDFSVAAWVCPEYPMRGLYGDILAKFDTERRCGLVLRMAGSSTAYSSMGDSRHISFCIDDGSVGHWEDCGRPLESNSLIAGMVVHDGEL